MASLAWLGHLADVVTIGGGVVALTLYGKASHNARTLVEAHLDVVSVWAGGEHGEGWEGVTIDQQIGWLNPTQTIFPLSSGPALIQLTLGDKLTLGASMVRAIAMLNQNIESFNAVLSKAEALRTQHAVWLARVHVAAVQRIAQLRSSGQPVDLDAVLDDRGNPDDMTLAARAVIQLLTILHSGLIGAVGGQGLYEAYRTVREEFNQGRPI